MVYSTAALWAAATDGLRADDWAGRLVVRTAPVLGFWSELSTAVQKVAQRALLMACQWADATVVSKAHRMAVRLAVRKEARMVCKWVQQTADERVDPKERMWAVVWVSSAVG